MGCRTHPHTSAEDSCRWQLIHSYYPSDSYNSQSCDIKSRGHFQRDKLNNDVSIIADNNLQKINKLTIIKNGLTYKYVHNDQDEFNAIPVLSKKQMLYLECCTLEPPCIIHGSAGSGKTLLSEELYQRFSEDKTKKTLYVTYMDQLKIDVSDHLEKRRNIKNTDCKTIDEIIRHYLGDDVFRNRYKTEDDFKRWVTEDKKLNEQCMKKGKGYGRGYKDVLRKINREDEELALSIVYIFFRTFSTESGYRSFTNNPNKPEGQKDENYFLSRCKDEKGLGNDEKREIFFLCQKYEQYLQSNRFINDNEAARQIMDKRVGEYDYIIVDEVQDLTETQILCLTSLLNNDRHLFIFGDDNQTINPTMMDISDVKNSLYDNGMKEIHFVEESDEFAKAFERANGFKENETKELNSSFRNSQFIVDYINYISERRRQSIGKSKGYNESDQKSELGETSNIESNYPAYILDRDYPISDSCLSQKNIFINNDVKIITANKKTKNQLLKKYPHLEETNSVYTIEETKGREWNQVILYDFFSSARSIWEKITGNKNDAEGNSLLVSRQSSIYRMYFNRYYVGITRTKSKVIIIETEKLSEKVRKTFFPTPEEEENVSLEQLKELSKFKAYFANDFTHDVWDIEALNCFNKSDYEGALDRQRRSITALDADESVKLEDRITLKKEYEKRCEKYIAYLNVKENRVAMDSKYLSIFIREKDLEYIGQFYNNTKDDLRQHILKLDPITDSDGYIEAFSKLDGFSCPEESEFFHSNAILAYKQKIFKMIEGRE